MAQAFQRAVVQVDVGELDLALLQRIRVNREIVIVGGDLDLAGVELLHRMVSAVVSEFEFESLAAESNPDQLMSQADAENRLLAHQFANATHGIVAGLRISWAIRQENAVT